MTDLEITRLCAEAMDVLEIGEAKNGTCIWAHSDTLSGEYIYDPLTNDKQAMELVKRFDLCIQPPQFVKPPRWHVWRHPKPNHTGIADALNLNRAICECVAKMWLAEKGEQ